MTTLKEANQSGWTQTWEILIGDFEEAKSLWTSVSDQLGNMIQQSADARNNLLQGWKDSGGRTMIIDSSKKCLRRTCYNFKLCKRGFHRCVSANYS